MSHRILVLDATPAMRAWYRTSLENAGYAVTLCDNARRARAVVRQDPPDVIICDDALGCVPSSWHLLAWLHQQPATTAIRVIIAMAVAHADGTVLPDCGRVRVSLLPKPFTAAELLACVGDALAGTAAGDALHTNHACAAVQPDGTAGGRGGTAGLCGVDRLPAAAPRPAAER
jgi:CheY-like chemotaxis protein